MEFVELLMLTIAVLLILQAREGKMGVVADGCRLGGRRFHVRRSRFDRHSRRTQSVIGEDEEND